MQEDDLEVGSSRRVGDGEETILHIWRFGNGNSVLDSETDWRLDGIARCGLFPRYSVVRSVLATWSQKYDYPYIWYQYLSHLHCSDSSLLCRTLESCLYGLWLLAY